VHLGVVAGYNLIRGKLKATGVDAQKPAHLDLTTGEDDKIPRFQRLQEAGSDARGGPDLL
jgi:hypothetical protein